MSKKKTYEHRKINLMKTMKAASGTEKVIQLIQEDKVEEALKAWDSVHHAMNFSLSEQLARSQIEWMRNDLIDLIESKSK